MAAYGGGEDQKDEKRKRGKTCDLPYLREKPRFLARTSGPKPA